jgi:hypothetical protein
MVWLNLSPIPEGRRGVISSFKLFLPAFPRVKEGGGWWGGLSILWEKTGVTNPESLNPDPDPGFDDKKIKKVFYVHKFCC